MTRLPGGALPGDHADEIALRRIHVGEVHPPAGQEHPEYRDFAADAIGALVGRIGVGADRKIAARTVADAADRNEAFGNRREGSFLIGVLTFLMTGLLALGAGYLVWLAT